MARFVRFSGFAWLLAFGCARHGASQRQATPAPSSRAPAPTPSSRAPAAAPVPTPVPALPAGAEPIETREVELAGEWMLVQRFKVDCGRRADGVFSPRLEPVNGAPARWLPADCAEEVERIWMTRPGGLQLVGAYPLRGVQLLGNGTVRRFAGASRFVGRQVLIAETAHWYWLSGAWRAGATQGSVDEEVQAEGEATNERIWRFEHGRLVPVRAELEPEPARHAPSNAWLATSYATSDLCWAHARQGKP